MEYVYEPIISGNPAKDLVRFLLERAMSIGVETTFLDQEDELLWHEATTRKEELLALVENELGWGYREQIETAYGGISMVESNTAYIRGILDGINIQQKLSPRRDIGEKNC